MAASDPTTGVPTPTGTLQGAAAFSWDGSAWQPSDRAFSSVATPTGVLRGVAPFSWSGGAWQPAGHASPGVPTPTGTLDGVAVYMWSGSAWTPAGGAPDVPTPTGTLQGIAAFIWDGSAWQPAGQAAPEVPTPTGVLAGMAMFNWNGAAWGAAPSLNLNFMQPGVLDPRITFTRASTATYFNNAGVMQTAAINAPRWDYNPSTLALNGLLIEEQRTNMVAPSVPTATGSWVPTAVTVTTNAGTAPDGTVTMTRVAESATTAVHFLPGGAVTTPGANYTASVYAKAAENRYLQLVCDDTSNGGAYATFDLQAGVISGALTSRGSGTGIAATMQPVGNGVYRCSVAATLGTQTTGRIALIMSITAAPAFAPSYAGNASNGLLVWGAQLEAGAFVTSYIPTTASAVARSADSCTVNTLVPWYSATASTFVLEGIMMHAWGAGTNSYWLILDDTTASNRLGMFSQTSAPTSISTIAASGGTSYANGTGLLNLTPPATFKYAIAVGGSQVFTYGNGTQLLSVAGTAPVGVSRFSLGSLGTVPINGYLRRLQYWPRVLTNAELQSVTT